MTRTWKSRAAAVLATLWLVSPGGAAAQPAARPESDVRVWTEAFVQGGVGAGSGWRWTSEALVKTRDGTGTLDSASERVMVMRELTPRSAVGVGYAFASAFPAAGAVREHRLVQQYVWSGGARPRVALKSYLEERFIAGSGAPVLRVRQQAKVTWPIARRLRGVVSDELFVQMNSTRRASRGFDGNVAFVGVGRTLTPRSSVEIGYLNVTWRPGSAPKRSHVLGAALIVSM